MDSLRLPLRRFLRVLAVGVAIVGWGAYRLRDTGRVDAAVLEQGATGPRLRVAIIGKLNDPRIPSAREAIGFWNHEFLRLGRRVQLDSPSVRSDPISDDLLRAASGESVIGFGPATSRLRAALSAVPTDIVIVLSQTDLISFSVQWSAGSRGVAGIRRSDIPPLSLPNTVRNVIAHEMGHVLGLDHNGDSKTLMCADRRRAAPPPSPPTPLDSSR